MKWHYTDGWNLDDFSTSVTISDDAELSAGQKTPFVQVASSAASKTLLLGLGEGDCMILMNSGNNAITVKNVEGDTGSSVAKGDIVLIVASETTDATSVEVLNGSGGGGGGTGGAFIVNITWDEYRTTATCDKTYQEIEDAVQSGNVVVFCQEDNGALLIEQLSAIGYFEGQGGLIMVSGTSTEGQFAAATFTASAKTDYPSHTEG